MATRWLPRHSVACDLHQSTGQTLYTKAELIGLRRTLLLYCRSFPPGYNGTSTSSRAVDSIAFPEQEVARHTYCWRPSWHETAPRSTHSTRPRSRQAEPKTERPVCEDRTITLHTCLIRTATTWKRSAARADADPHDGPLFRWRQRDLRREAAPFYLKSPEATALAHQDMKISRLRAARRSALLRAWSNLS
jgi:hypothetical protein